MSDLISRQAAIDAFVDLYDRVAFFDKEIAARAIGIIKALPSADVLENVHGEWMHDKDDALVSGYCSCCGWTTIYTESEIAYMQFCPSCGADMRSKDAD